MLLKHLKFLAITFSLKQAEDLDTLIFKNGLENLDLASNPDTGEKPLTGIEVDEKPGDVSSPYRYKTSRI